MRNRLTSFRNALIHRALITGVLLTSFAQTEMAAAQGAANAPKQEVTGDIVVTATRTSTLASKTPVALRE